MIVCSNHPKIKCHWILCGIRHSFSHMSILLFIFVFVFVVVFLFMFRVCTTLKAGQHWSLFTHTPTHSRTTHTHPPPFNQLSLESHVATDRTPCGCPDAKFLEFTDSPSSTFLEIKLNHNLMLSFKYSTYSIWLYDSTLEQSEIYFCVISFINLFIF